MKPSAIVTDIEGTTSSIAFVHEVLFPYAAEALPGYLRAHAEDHGDIVDAVRAEAGEADADLERVIAILLEWIAADRKATPLKALQGHIWTHGYQSGAFRGHVYADAARNLKAWKASGLRLFVYSSGSVKAQKLLFAHSEAGDLTPLFEGYFDTTTGPKKETASYRAMATAIGLAPAEVLFLSDVTAELDAAAAAGMQTLQLVRSEGMETGDHEVVRDFDAIDLGESS